MSPSASGAAQLKKVVLFFVVWLGLVGIIAPPVFAWWLSGRLLAGSESQPRDPGDGLAPGPLTNPEVDFTISYEDVEFDAGEGVTLRGWLVPGAEGVRAAVATAHGSGSDRRSFLGLLPEIHEAGYAMLLFDLRGHGLSDSAEPGARGGAREDLLAAVRFLRGQRDFERVAVMGASLSATGAILAAAQSPEIDAVVAEGSATNVLELLRAQRSLRFLPDWMIALTVDLAGWRVDPSSGWGAELSEGALGVVDRIAPRPLLLIHGREDSMIPVEQAERLYAAAREPKSLWIIEGGGHSGLRRLVRDEYARRVVAFLASSMPVQR